MFDELARWDGQLEVSGLPLDWGWLPLAFPRVFGPILCSQDRGWSQRVALGQAAEGPQKEEAEQAGSGFFSLKNNNLRKILLFTQNSPSHPLSPPPSFSPSPHGALPEGIPSGGVVNNNIIIPAQIFKKLKVVLKSLISKYYSCSSNSKIHQEF